LWPGFPKYFATTSGTTSKVKYIPVTKESIKNHIEGPQYIGVNYACKYKKTAYLKGKILLFSDGHVFNNTAVIKSASISSIKHKEVPWFYSLRSLPSPKINAIKDFDFRMQEIVRTSIGQDIRSIVAMPIAFMSFLRKFKEITGKKLYEAFPNFQLLISSGMNYEPYLKEYEEYIGGPFDILETYPSTEGFLGYQDQLKEKGIQLLLNKGIFFEFVPIEDLDKDEAKRLSLRDVETGRDYAIILNTVSGLWAYVLGDLVRFVSLFPHRIEIRGRINHYISAFGEHVLAEETDKAINDCLNKFDARMVNYTVAPFFKEGELPYHEWFIEFSKAPENINLFEIELNSIMSEINYIYGKLVNRNAISSLKIRIIRKDGFAEFIHKTGKRGVQQKIPQVSNNESISKKIRHYIV